MRTALSAARVGIGGCLAPSETTAFLYMRREIKAMTFIPHGLPTALGSFPHADVQTACRLVLEYFPDVPMWPQMSRLGFHENMYVQFSQGLPGLVLDEEHQKIFFDTSQDLSPALEAFYERIIADDVDYFGLGPDYAIGFHALMDMLRAAPANADGFIKGQVTGPVSLGLTVTDQNLRATLYNETLADTIVKNIAMKARWQVRQLKSVRPNVLICVDEPYMVSWGSAFVNVSAEMVRAMLEAFSKRPAG